MVRKPKVHSSGVNKKVIKTATLLTAGNHIRQQITAVAGSPEKDLGCPNL